jgi:hypothetical protein
LSGTSVRPFGGDGTRGKRPRVSNSVHIKLPAHVYISILYSFVFVVVIRSVITASLYIYSPTAWTFSHLGKLKTEKDKKKLFLIQEKKKENWVHIYKELNCKTEMVSRIYLFLSKKKNLRKRRRRRKSKRNGQDAGETNGQRILL